MLIVIVGIYNYYIMLFFLQITYIVIATIHMWFRPYKDKFLNIFDGLILQLMLVIVIISSFDFLQPVMTEISVILVVFPLPLLCISIIVMKIIKRRRHGYACIYEDDPTW